MKKINKTHAFTLVEVLIALAILAISLTALVKTTTVSIEDIYYLKQKTIAHYVAENILARIQLGLVNPPYAPFVLEDKSNMLQQTWYWEAHLNETKFPTIAKVTVTVSNKEKGKALITTNGFTKAVKS